MASFASGEVKEEEKKLRERMKKESLGWVEWLRGWFNIIYEMLFQRIIASHLQNPLPLPPLSDLTCIVTGSTSGIGREIARFLAPSPCLDEANLQIKEIFIWFDSFFSFGIGNWRRQGRTL